MHRKHLVAAVAAVALAGTALGGPASAGDPAAKPNPNTLAKNLLSPLSLAVADNGTVYYSQNFAGILNSKRPGKKPRTVYAAPVPGTEVGAVSVKGDSLRFATTFLPEEGQEGEPATALMGFSKKGKAKKLADLWSFEEKRNPDGDVRGPRFSRAFHGGDRPAGRCHEGHAPAGRSGAPAHRAPRRAAGLAAGAATPGGVAR